MGEKMRPSRLILSLFLMAMVVVWAAGCSKSGGKPVKPEYSDFYKVSTEAAAIPGLENGLVPQGFSYIPDKDWYVISNYYEDGSPSVLTVVEAATGKYVKTLALSNTDGTPFTGHVGGVAVSRQNVWIASEKYMRRLPVSQIVEAADNSTIAFSDQFQTPSDASFAFYSNGVLWSGEFYQKRDYPTDETHHLKVAGGTNYAAASGYILDEAADILPEGKKTGADAVVTPDYYLSLPDRIQGLAVLSNGQLALSQSYGRNNDSTIYYYKNVLLENSTGTMNLTGTDAPVWILDKNSLLSSLQAPPMTEGIVQRDDGFLTILFESGAQKYSDGKYPLKTLFKTKIPQ